MRFINSSRFALFIFLLLLGISWNKGYSKEGEGTLRLIWCHTETPLGDKNGKLVKRIIFSAFLENIGNSPVKVLTVLPSGDPSYFGYGVPNLTQLVYSWRDSIENPLGLKMIKPSLEALGPVVLNKGESTKLPVAEMSLSSDVVFDYKNFTVTYHVPVELGKLYGVWIGSISKIGPPYKQDSR
jgi:hypothetical protein